MELRNRANRNAASRSDRAEYKMLMSFVLLFRLIAAAAAASVVEAHRVGRWRILRPASRRPT